MIKLLNFFANSVYQCQTYLKHKGEQTLGTQNIKDTPTLSEGIIFSCLLEQPCIPGPVAINIVPTS